MARQQSSKIYINGKYHKEIYFQGHYHDKVYIGSQLVWEKLSLYGTYVSYVIASFKNEVYANGHVADNDGNIISYNTVCKYNFDEDCWVIIKTNAIVSGSLLFNIWCGENGILLQNQNIPGIVIGYNGKTVTSYMNNFTYRSVSLTNEMVQTNVGTIRGQFSNSAQNNIGIILFNYNRPDDIIAQDEMEGYRLSNITCVGNKIYAVGTKSEEIEFLVLYRTYKATFTIEFDASTKTFSYEKNTEYTWLSTDAEPGDIPYRLLNYTKCFNNGFEHKFFVENEVREQGVLVRKEVLYFNNTMNGELHVDKYIIAKSGSNNLYASVTARDSSTNVVSEIHLDGESVYTGSVLTTAIPQSGRNASIHSGFVEVVGNKIENEELTELTKNISL